MQQGRIRRYLRHGTLPQLRVFEAVVRHGSYTRAAAELQCAQPTVSVQIRKLTETVGVPLLKQSGRRVHVTAAGHALHEACRDLFETLSCLEDVLATLRDGSPPSLPEQVVARGAERPGRLATDG
jgi:DNA-binding transcriptional LysR family regulator